MELCTEILEVKYKLDVHAYVGHNGRTNKAKRILVTLTGRNPKAFTEHIMAFLGNKVFSSLVEYHVHCPGEREG